MPRHKTQPKSSEHDNTAIVRLVQITDPHLMSTPESALRGINTRDSFESVLLAAQSFIDQSQAILLTGDIAHDEKASTYKQLVERLNQLQTPVWSLPGNHDNPMEMSHLLAAGQYHYLGHHSAANWEIILLDSHYAGQPAGLLGEEELARLELRLRNSDAEHLLICLHHHPLPMHSRWLDKVALLDANEFISALHKSTRVRAVCCGHVHQATDKLSNKVRFLSCPSTGTQFQPLHNEFALDTRPPGFRWLKLYPDGTIQTDVAWLNSPPWE